MGRATLVIAVLLAAAASLAGQARTADAAHAAPVPAPTLDQAIMTLLNETRAQHGLHPLALSRALESAAVSHSRAMLQDGFFAHSSAGSPFAARLKRFYSPSGYTYWSAGENLLYQTGSLDAGTAIRAWLASPEHRRNMLDPTWREVGVASMYAPSAGGTFGGQPTWVVTMDFGARIGSGTPASKPTPVRTPAIR